MVKLVDKLPKPAPATYAEAISALQHHLHEISELIESKKLDHVHAEAAEVRDIAKTLARLAKMDGSGVKGAAMKEIDGAAKDLAAQYGPMDNAGDSLPANFRNTVGVTKKSRIVHVTRPPITTTATG